VLGDALRLPGLEGRVALVTGANHDIGAATARLLAAHGARVLVAYLRVEDPPDLGVPEGYRANRRRSGEEIAAAINDAGGQAVAVEADLRDATAAEQLLDAAEDAFDGVDILINNATGWQADTFGGLAIDDLGRRLEEVSATTFEANFAVDARAAALLIAGYARRHRQRGARWGRILGLTSGGPMGFPREVSYGAAKGALERYTMAASIELAAQGVTANIVYPPVTDTGWVTDEVRELVATSEDLVHVADPDEVAWTLAWLSSDLGQLITGNIIRLR
jgi:3-oxoacyl-[acyl-carrier protein] reductase